MERSPARVERTAFLLGFAGLLPQVLAVALILVMRQPRMDGGVLGIATYVFAICYGAVILSFLGGIWWGQAMRRPARQGVLAAAAVTPSLVGLACMLAALIGVAEAGWSPWPAVVLGSAIMLTLLVDRHLVSTGEAPANWMRLRVPLSLGLGGLTIAAGVLVAV